jgi:PKD repeat protein
MLNKDTTITVQLTDGCGSTLTSKTITINVAPAPTASFITNVESGCYPLCIQFENVSNISSGKIASWGWDFGNGDTSHEQNPIYCYRDTGTFSVALTASSGHGCTSTTKVLDLIKVYSHPHADFIYSPQPVNILNPEVQFTNNSSGGYPLSAWYWFFDDGTSNSSDENPVHTYKDTGRYCVDFIIRDEHGCIDSTTKCLEVNPLFTFYIPDAFTPNGDGINDMFLPKGSYVKDYEMFIFDRW